jgi:hypothetical protein
MKPFIICFTCCLFILQNIKSQDSLKSDEAKTHTAITAHLTFMGNLSMKVHIMDIKDSSIFILQTISGKRDPFHKADIYQKSGWESYSYREIESIQVRNKKLRSWLIPVAIVGGVVAGALIGYAGAKNDGGLDGAVNQGAGIVVGGLLGGGIGAVTGVLISKASDKKYLINGDWKSFEEMKTMMSY